MHEPGYRTDTIGSYTDGQLFDSVTAGFSGTTADGEAQVIATAQNALQEWLSQLPDLVFADIAIRLFQVEAHGIMFGLVGENG